MVQEATLGPRTPGNQSRRFPPSEKPTGLPSATGASGRPPAHIMKITYSKILPTIGNISFSLIIGLVGRLGGLPHNRPRLKDTFEKASAPGE